MSSLIAVILQGEVELFKLLRLLQLVSLYEFIKSNLYLDCLNKYRLQNSLYFSVSSLINGLGKY